MSYSQLLKGERNSEIEGLRWKLSKIYDFAMRLELAQDEFGAILEIVPESENFDKQKAKDSLEAAFYLIGRIKGMAS